MVSRPLQIATVGERTFSITRLNGSVTPVASRSARCWISGSNLEKRSVISNIPCPFVSSEVETPVSTALCRGSSRLRSMRTVKRGLPLQFFHRGDELADILEDSKSGGSGKSVSVRLALGGRRLIQKQTPTINQTNNTTT